MTERIFRIIIGTLLLLGLYLDFPAVLWALVALLVFQGITNWRVPKLVSRLRYGPTIQLPRCCAATPDAGKARINFEAERALCLIVAALLILGYGVYNAPLWFLPWFIGFALTAAGLSGICPMILALKKLGFR